MNLDFSFLQFAIKRFEYYKSLGDKTLLQLSDQQIHFQPNEESNSIAHIVQHISGNMLSRFTDFLVSDGEKEWRKRDAEFETQNTNKETIIEIWQKGWECCLFALQSLKPEDLSKIIYIRGEEHSAMDAIIRQLAHYPYHIGQMVYIGKLILNQDWQNLSIPRGNSENFNQEMFSKITK